MSDTLLLQKAVDKSVLYQGLTIPNLFVPIFFEKMGFNLKHGEARMIKILIDGAEYDAKLVNQNFDRSKYTKHTDVVQIRYGENSPIANRIRDKFPDSLKSVTDFRLDPRNKGKQQKIDDSKKEYVVLYATPVLGTIMMECISNAEYIEEVSSITKLGEVDYETAIDTNATILIEYGAKKVRRLSKAIGNSLKKIYGFKCQICGQYIGEKYGSSIIHAHHIDYFTKSLNNNADNIMIVCPNHHGIIHDRNPEFDRNAKTYRYPNGYVEGLKINLHL